MGPLADRDSLVRGLERRTSVFRFGSEDRQAIDSSEFRALDDRSRVVRLGVLRVLGSKSKPLEAMDRVVSEPKFEVSETTYISLISIRTHQKALDGTSVLT